MDFIRMTQVLLGAGWLALSAGIAPAAPPQFSASFSEGGATVAALQSPSLPVESVAASADRYTDRGRDSATSAQRDGTLRLTVPPRMVNDKTLTLKAEVLDVYGRINWRTFAALGSVSAVRVSDQSPVAIEVTVFERRIAGAGAGGPNTDDEIRFYNGVGSVSFTLVNGAAEAPGDMEITVTIADLSASKVVTILDAGAPDLFKDLSGTLVGDDLNWGPEDGVIHLVGNVGVPAGETLTIDPGTLIMVDRGASGSGTAVLIGDATVNAQGTQADPIFFFPTEGPAAMSLPQDAQLNPASWRGLLHSGSGTSTYAYVFLTGAGNGPMGGHPRPAVMTYSSSYSVNISDCVFADCPGKVYHSGGSGTYNILRSLHSRTGYGGEFVGNGYTLTIEDCWFTRTGHAPEPAELDGDVLHVDRSGSTVNIRRCILTDCGDDLVDHSAGATPVIESCIMYDARDKTVSLDGSAGATITMTNCLVYKNPGGVRCRTGTAFLTNCTFGHASNVNGRSDDSDIDKCIFASGGTMGAGTCTGTVNYTLVNDPDLLGCGTGNFHDDPLFVDPPSGNYNLLPGSPAIDAGPDGERIGWLGFPETTSCIDDVECYDGDDCTVDTCELGDCAYTPVADCCLADSDLDGDVDLTDFAGFAACLAAIDPPYDCCVFDGDEDGDVDLLDFAAFQEVFTGE